MISRLVFGAGAGGLAWTFAEYWLHRGPMHRAGARDPLGSEHRAHHVDPAATSALARTGGVLGLATLGWVVTRPARRHLGSGADGLAIGWAVGYAAYDRLHWNVHHRAPSSADDARRRRHLDHHVNPRRNFGVTTSVWDRAFGTFVEPDVVRLPRRLAPAWLVEEPGLAPSIELRAA
ncbi:MAG: sterol desaturase family protein [Actinomycetota bacterium]